MKLRLPHEGDGLHAWRLRPHTLFWTTGLFTRSYRISPHVSSSTPRTRRLQVCASTSSNRSDSLPAISVHTLPQACSPSPSSACYGSRRRGCVRDRRLCRHFALDNSLFKLGADCPTNVNLNCLQLSDVPCKRVSTMPSPHCYQQPVARATRTSLSITVTNRSSACGLFQETWLPSLRATLNEVPAAGSNLLRCHVKTLP